MSIVHTQNPSEEKINVLVEYWLHDGILMIFIAEKWTQNHSLMNSSDTFVDTQPLGDKLWVIIGLIIMIGLIIF